MSVSRRDPGEATFGEFAGAHAPEGDMVRPVAASPATRMFSVHLRHGERLERHLAPGPLALLVIDGEIDLEVGDERARLSAGQCCLVGSGAPHALSGAGEGESVTVGVLGVEAPADGQADAVGDGSVTDLNAVLSGSTGRGVLWSLPAGSGVNLNLARLGASDAIDEHVNDLLDVVYLGLEGEGALEVDGAARSIRPGQVTLVRAGQRRALFARASVFSYLTLHRERHGLSLGRRRR